MRCCTSLFDVDVLSVILLAHSHHDLDLVAYEMILWNSRNPENC